MVTKKIRHKNAAGTVYEYDIGAKAENVAQDANHRFASDEEKENWNGKIGADTQIEFTEAKSRQNINTKETLGTILGKVKKFFTDLKPHAFYDLVQNATTAAVDRAVSAAVAKNLQDQINQQNTKINMEGTGIRSRVLFCVIGGYAGCSQVPFPNADKYNISVTSVSSFGDSQQAIFDWTITRSKSGFSLNIENPDAVYYFGTLYPNRLWEVFFNATLI